MVICLHQQVEIAAKGPCYYAFFILCPCYKTPRCLGSGRRALSQKLLCFYAPLICKKKFGVLPSLLLQQGKKGETQEKKKKGWDTGKKKKGETHSFSKNVWETEWWNWEFGSWAVFLENEESPPCPLLAFISFFINRGLGMLTCSVATLLAINTFADALFIAFICKYGPLQTGCDNYTE